MCLHCQRILPVFLRIIFVFASSDPLVHRVDRSSSSRVICFLPVAFLPHLEPIIGDQLVASVGLEDLSCVKLTLSIPGSMLGIARWSHASRLPDSFLLLEQFYFSSRTLFKHPQGALDVGIFFKFGVCEL